MAQVETEQQRKAKKVKKHYSYGKRGWRKHYLSKIDFKIKKMERNRGVEMINGKPHRKRKVHVRAYDRHVWAPVHDKTYGFLKRKRKRKRKN